MTGSFVFVFVSGISSMSRSVLRYQPAQGQSTPAFHCLRKKDFPNPWNEHLCRGMNAADESRVTNTQHNTLPECGVNTLQTGQIHSFVEVAQLDTNQKLFFLLTTPRELRSVILWAAHADKDSCVQKWTEIWSDSQSVKKNASSVYC